jgi:hypothetical protein
MLGFVLGFITCGVLMLVAGKETRALAVKLRDWGKDLIK